MRFSSAWNQPTGNDFHHARGHGQVMPSKWSSSRPYGGRSSRAPAGRERVSRAHRCGRRASSLLPRIAHGVTGKCRPGGAAPTHRLVLTSVARPQEVTPSVAAQATGPGLIPSGGRGHSITANSTMATPCGASSAHGRSAICCTARRDGRVHPPPNDFHERALAKY
jgi:hypothetical protein